MKVFLTLFFCLISWISLIPLSAHAKLTDKQKVLATTAIAAASKNKNKKEENINLAQERLAKVAVTGVDSELKKNIELHMPVTIPHCQADKSEVKLFFTNVKKHLRKASRSLGYYDANFRSGGKIVKDCWNLRLRITPGRVTKVVKQEIKVIGEGSKAKIFQEILKEKPYQKGDTLNHQKYSDYKTALSEAAQSLGYFDAEFEKHSIRVNPITYQASVALVLNTKSRYRYGKITVDQKVLSNNVLQEYLTLKTGQNYETEAIINQQQFLQASGYFKQVKIDVLHDQAENRQIPINITLVAKKRNNYKIKLGYGTDTGLRTAVEMKRRWTGSSGKQLLAKVQLAQKLSGVSLQLTDPKKNPDDDDIVYHIDWTQDKRNYPISESIDVGGKHTRKTSHNWTQTTSISYLLDKTQVEGEAEVKSKYLLFGVGLEKTRADDLLYPEHGWYLKLVAKGAIKSLASDQNFLQFKAVGKNIQPLGKGRLITRLQLGTSLVDDINRLPKRLRFFAGGGNSIRGYEFESLGEVNSSGNVVGGKQLLTLSLEYQHPITEEWSAAAFVDAGNAFDDWGNYSIKVGVGFGARWRSPVGPVRIDIGFPKDDFTDPHLHLSVGSDL